MELDYLVYILRNINFEHGLFIWTWLMVSDCDSELVIKIIDYCWRRRRHCTSQNATLDLYFCLVLCIFHCPFLSSLEAKNFPLSWVLRSNPYHSATYEQWKFFYVIMRSIKERNGKFRLGSLFIYLFFKHEGTRVKLK